MKISNVLIFKSFEEITKVKFKNPLPVSFNFNYNQVIGHAFLIETADGIYADIVISEPFALRTVACPSLFPYLGGEVDRDRELFTAKDVAIGIYPNKDETIPMISPNQIQI